MVREVVVGGGKRWRGDREGVARRWTGVVEIARGR